MRLHHIGALCPLLGVGTLFFSHEAIAKMSRQDFGKTPDGAVSIYTLTNRKGMEARIINYGGIIVSLKVPDRAGKPGDVVLGFESLDGYLKENPYFGALIG